MDVDTAFLNADIDEDTWVKIPEGTKLVTNDDGKKKEERRKTKSQQETQTSQKQQHNSQALVSSIILLSRSLVSSGPFPRNERQPALSQGFRGFM